MKTRSNITTLDQILDKKYGKKGQPKREEWEHNLMRLDLVFYLKKQELNLA